MKRTPPPADTPPETTTEAFERAIASEPAGDEHYVFRLFVTGMTPRSTEAYANIKALCDQHLPGRYEIEVVDVYQHPSAAVDEQIVAVPTLVKKLPLPLRKLIGNLSDKDRVLIALDVRPIPGSATPP
jgi:circadian clock protein KaiB